MLRIYLRRAPGRARAKSKLHASEISTGIPQDFHRNCTGQNSGGRHADISRYHSSPRRARLSPMKTCLDCKHLVTGTLYCNSGEDRYTVHCGLGLWSPDCYSPDLVSDVMRARKCGDFVMGADGAMDDRAAVSVDGRVGEYL